MALFIYITYNQSSNQHLLVDYDPEAIFVRKEGFSFF